MLKLNKEYEEQLFFPLAKTLQQFNTTQESSLLAKLIYQFISHTATCLFSDYYHNPTEQEKSKELEDFLFQSHSIDLDFQIKLIALLIAAHPIHEPYFHPNLKLLEMTFWEEVEQMREFHRLAKQGSFLISLQELKKSQKLFQLTLERFHDFISNPIIMLDETLCTYLNGTQPQKTTASTDLRKGIYLKKQHGEFLPLTPGYQENPTPDFKSFEFLETEDWKKSKRFRDSFERYQREQEGKLDFSSLEEEHPKYVLAYRFQSQLKTFLKKPEKRMLCIGEPGAGKTALMVHLEQICKLKNFVVVKYFVQYQTLLQSSEIFIRYLHYLLSQHVALDWRAPKDPTELKSFFQEMLKNVSKLDVQVLLIIDNLDDAIEPFFPGEESLFDLITQEFPSNFKILVTSRANFSEKLYLTARCLNLPPLTKQESQKFFKELGYKKSLDMIQVYHSEGNPLMLTEMYNWGNFDLKSIPSLETYFRKLFIRYSTADNLKLFSIFVQHPHGIMPSQLAKELGWLSPLVKQQLTKILPLIRINSEVIQLFHPLFHEYLEQLLKNLPFPKKAN